MEWSQPQGRVGRMGVASLARCAAVWQEWVPSSWLGWCAASGNTWGDLAVPVAAGTLCQLDDKPHPQHSAATSRRSLRQGQALIAGTGQHCLCQVAAATITGPQQLPQQCLNIGR